MTMVSHPRPTLPLTARESPSSSSITCVRTFPLGSPSLIVSEEAISYIMAKLVMAKKYPLAIVNFSIFGYKKLFAVWILHFYLTKAKVGFIGGLIYILDTPGP